MKAFLHHCKIQLQKKLKRQEKTLHPTQVKRIIYIFVNAEFIPDLHQFYGITCRLTGSSEARKMKFQVVKMIQKENGFNFYIRGKFVTICWLGAAELCK